MRHSRRILLLAGLAVFFVPGLSAQAPPPKAPAAPAAPANPFLMSPEERARLDQLAREDHADMLRQLGITQLRPGLRRPGRRRRAERRELRPRQGQPLSGLAGRPDPEGRPQGHDGGNVVAEAASRDRRGLRARGLRPRAQGRAEGHVDGGRDRGDDRRRPAGRRPAGDRARRQLPPSRDHGRHQDGGGRTGQRKGTRPGPHDVRLGQHARRAAAALPGLPGARRPALHRSAHRRRLGLRVAQHRQHPGRQRRRPHLGHHRARQPGEAPHARAVGCAARVGLGRGPGARLPRDAARGRRQARGHRRGLALRQGRPRHHGLRAPLRRRPRGVLRRGRRQAAPPQLRGGGGEPRGFGRLPLDGRQLPEVRRPRRRRSGGRTRTTSRSTRTSSSRCARRARPSSATASRRRATPTGSTSRAATWPRWRPARSFACSGRGTSA